MSSFVSESDASAMVCSFIVFHLGALVFPAAFCFFSYCQIGWIWMEKLSGTILILAASTSHNNHAGAPRCVCLTFRLSADAISYRYFGSILVEFF